MIRTISPNIPSKASNASPSNDTFISGLSNRGNCSRRLPAAPRLLRTGFDDTIIEEVIKRDIVLHNNGIPNLSLFFVFFVAAEMIVKITLLAYREKVDILGIDFNGWFAIVSPVVMHLLTILYFFGSMTTRGRAELWPAARPFITRTISLATSLLEEVMSLMFMSIRGLSLQ